MSYGETVAAFVRETAKLVGAETEDVVRIDVRPEEGVWVETVHDVFGMTNAKIEEG